MLLAGSELNIVLEVASHLSDTDTRYVAFHSTEGLERGAPVVDTGTFLSVPVGDAILGRMMNVFGHAIDEKPLVKCGDDVLVSTYSAFRGDDLATLRDKVEKHLCNWVIANARAQSVVPIGSGRHSPLYTAQGRVVMAKQKDQSEQAGHELTQSIEQ